MRKIKRLAAAILTVALALSLIVVPASAAPGSFSDVSDKNTAVNADILRLMGVVTGTGGNQFNPHGTLTRAQFATMVMTFLQKGDEAPRYATRTIFTDVTSTHWARSFVNMAASYTVTEGEGENTQRVPLVSGVGDGRFLPDEILALPPKGCINVHSSLLPKYRGSAPINWAILNGEAETGVTIQRMVHDMDAGDILLQRSTPIGETEDAEQLYSRLADMGGELVVEAVAQIQAGTASYTPQDHTRATLAPMLSKAMSPVDWTRSAQEIFNQIRGLYPWPGASTDIITGEPVKLWRAQVVEKHTDAIPGTVIAAGKQGIDVACGELQHVLRILELQPPGKKRMSAADYLRGHPIQVL